MEPPPAASPEPAPLPAGWPFGPVPGQGSAGLENSSGRWTPRCHWPPSGWRFVETEEAVSEVVAMQSHPLLSHGSSKSDTKEDSTSGAWHSASTRIRMTDMMAKLSQRPCPRTPSVTQSTATTGRRPPARTAHSRPRSPDAEAPSNEVHPRTHHARAVHGREGTRAVTWASLGGPAPSDRRQSQRPPVRRAGTSPPSESRQGPEGGGTAQATGFSSAGCKRSKVRVR